MYSYQVVRPNRRRAATLKRKASAGKTTTTRRLALAEHLLIASGLVQLDSKQATRIQRKAKLKP